MKKYNRKRVAAALQNSDVRKFKAISMLKERSLSLNKEWQ